MPTRDSPQLHRAGAGASQTHISGALQDVGQGPHNRPDGRGWPAHVPRTRRSPLGSSRDEQGSQPATTGIHAPTGPQDSTPR